MSRTSRHAVFSLALVSLAAATPSAPADDARPVDFTKISLEELRVKPIKEAKDPKTGFVVGGKNETKLIKELKEINGIAIADLEKAMRPGKSSEAGFLGNDERLLDVMATDNDFVLKAGLTHQEIALQLRVMQRLIHKAERAETRTDGFETKPFIYLGIRFQGKLRGPYAGVQDSPFNDDTFAGEDYVLINLDTKEKLEWSPLVPAMVERYGFYEGKGTSYRLDPKKAIEFLAIQKFAGTNKPVKVFILAGQSNMEGHGFIAADPKRNGGKGSLEHAATDPATADKFKHLLGKDGKWAVRDDVWIHYLDRKGKLTAGFGVKEDRIGPELGFGHVIGEAYEEPVLLIKLAWGGKSLGKDFRPPSAGGEVGPYYKEIVQRTKDVLADLKKQFPEFGDRGYELAGFGWHQGWNDRVNQAFVDEYEKNMAHFIRDIRKDLGAKNLPFVIAETGMTGPEEKHPRALALMKAQAAVADYPEFKGNVAFVGTKAFWRETTASPSNQGYHWNSNAETYYLIGDAMGTAMKKLCEVKPAK